MKKKTCLRVWKIGAGSGEWTGGSGCDYYQNTLYEFPKELVEYWIKHSETI